MKTSTTGLMSLDVDETAHSPWFHVHFTAPTGPSSRPLVRCEQERRRIRDLIQGKDAFLAPTSVRKTSRPAAVVATRPDVIKDQKDEWKKQSQMRIERELSNLTSKRELNIIKTKDHIRQNKRKDNDIYSSIGDLTLGKTPKLARIDGDERGNTILPNLPPLQSSKAMTSGSSDFCCSSLVVKKPDTATASRTKTSKKSTCFCSNKNASHNSMSIASGYDLREMKPPRKPKRKLVGILKRNTRTDSYHEKGSIPPQGQVYRLTGSDETSGYDSEDDLKKAPTKKVRFAEGTNFECARKTYRTKVKNITFRKAETNLSDDDETLLHDAFDMTFREFIEMKREERKRSSEQHTSRANRITSYLRSDSDKVSEKLPSVDNRTGVENSTNTGPSYRWRGSRGNNKQKGVDEKGRLKRKEDVSLPTVVN